VFFKYGYKRVSMNEIAEAAGTVEAAKKRYLRQKWAHILTGAVRGFKLVAKSAIELRKLTRDLVVIILAA
jgi:Bacterial regulatory proteins, tetR family